MRISLEWLGEYVDLVVEVEELADLLVNSGTEVASIQSIGGDFEGLLVGRVIAVKPHPNADRLSLCLVDTGGATSEIVCGAPNVRPGVYAPVALPGSKLPDGTEIKEAKIRGINSRGMLLSGRELGVSEDARGILLLDGEMEEGGDLERALGLPDTVLDLDVTPNRPDCLSVIGVAREVAALTGQELRYPRFEFKEAEERTDSLVQVDILDGDLCSRYVARVIDDLKAKDSPWWMQRRLQAAGVRPINNVVDVTNYVMLELGQPLHAFDYDLVEDGHIIVRRANLGEVLRTLDGVERALSKEDLLICDPSGAIALAGVMGGEHSEVSPSTARVLLESARFDPAAIMRTSRLMELSSEASYRFERGVDPGGCLLAAERAAYLMQEQAGGRVLAGAVDVVARSIDSLELSLRVKRAGRLIGIPLSVKEASGLLHSIGMEVREGEAAADEEEIGVTVPTFRPDLEREIDLVEEIARLYGYGRIPSTLPGTSHNIGLLTRDQKLRREMARILTGLGLYEAITYSFINPKWLDILDPLGECFSRDILRLRNPVSEDASIMRTTLIPGLLDGLRFNINRRNLDVFIFEIGRVFLPDEGQKLPREPLRLGCALMGNWAPKQWMEEPREVDFFTLKGMLETLLASLHVEGWSVSRAELPFLHPYQSCSLELKGEPAGFVGMIHPRVAREAELPASTALMELEVEPLLLAAREREYYEEIPRYPSIQMDMAVVVEETVDSAEVTRVIDEAGGELLREARLFDCYQGEQLAEGEKSLAYSLVFYAMERTLRDEEAHSVYERIIDALGSILGARLRGD